MCSCNRPANAVSDITKPIAIEMELTFKLRPTVISVILEVHVLVLHFNCELSGIEFLKKVIKDDLFHRNKSVKVQVWNGMVTLH